MRISGSGLDDAARAAERDARNRIQRAEQETEQARLQGETRLEEVRQEYSGRADVERARREAEAVQEQAQGAEAIREIRRKQSEELARVKREGEKTLGDTKTHFDREIQSAGRQGSRSLETTQASNARAISEEDLRTQSALKLAGETHQAQEAMVQSHREDRLRALQERMATDTEALRAQTSTATEQARARYEKIYLDETARHDENLGALRERTARSLGSTRAEYTDKLAAYRERQKDPFYRVQALDAELDDRGDAYVIRARIPTHEQAKLTVAVQDGRILVGGSRRAEEVLQGEDGHVVRTHSYQTYQEAFPIDAPADGKLLTKQFEGDLVTITVPKRAYAGGAVSRNPAATQPAVGRSRAETPRFPENLPLVGGEARAKRGEDGVV